DLGTLLEACPNLHVLATSRELLRIDGELEYQVLPLAEPDAVELLCPGSARTERGDRGALPAVGQHAARARARRRSREGADSGADPRADRAAPRPLQGRPRFGSTATDPARNDRMEPRAADTRRAASVRATCGLRGRVHARGSRAGSGGRSRHAPVACGEEPR